jgi:predicted peptidase
MRLGKRMCLTCLVMLSGCGVWLGTKVIGKNQIPKTMERQITKTVSCNYLLYLPKGYGEQDQKWPLMLFLHGSGERGDDLDLVKRHGPPKLVAEGKDFPFIIVSPQCPLGQWWPEKIDTLVALLDDVQSAYAVDPNRVYLTGLSIGGYGTWALACEHPDRFAAIAPICGGGEPFLADRLRDVPVWAFHGAKDPVVPVIESEVMVEAVRRAGGQAKLTIYPDAGHDAWTAAYNDPELYVWLLSHRRAERGK